MADLHHIPLPAGWYPDPEGGDHRRWWDGKVWTQHIAPFQRKVLIYEVDDLAATAGAQLPSVVPVSSPAPHRIRTAARLGRSLAALAHRFSIGTKNGDAAKKPAAAKKPTLKATTPATDAESKKPATRRGPPTGAHRAIKPAAVKAARSTRTK